MSLFEDSLNDCTVRELTKDVYNLQNHLNFLRQAKQEGQTMYIEEDTTLQIDDMTMVLPKMSIDARIALTNESLSLIRSTINRKEK